MAESINPYSGRICQYQDELRKQSLDAGVISHQETIYYLTGISYRPLERPFFLVIPSKKEDGSRLLVPRMERGHFETELRRIGITNLTVLEYEEYLARSGRNWYDSLNALLKGFGRRIAIEPGMPTEQSDKIREYLAERKGSGETHRIAEKLRVVKSREEIGFLRRASTYAEGLVRNVLATSYPGVTVAQLFALGRETRTRMFSDSYAAGVVPDVLHTDALCAVWPAPHSSKPHYIPNLHDSLGKGPHIAFGFATFNGYWAEVERTYFVEEPNDIERHYYNVMMRARQAALAVLAPGVKALQVDEAANAVFRNEGLEGRVLHRTGHGIGIEHHEAPFFSSGDDTVLKPGMVVTIEPGIYIPEGQPGAGGYRHSDTILITNDGYEILTGAIPTDISSMTFAGFWHGVGHFFKVGKRFKGWMTRKALNISQDR